MPRWLRWLLAGVAGFLLLLLVVLAFLPTFIDVNRYRGEVAARLEAVLGREVTVERLSLSFLPTPTLGVQGLVIGERGVPPEGPIPHGERFVELDRLGLKLRLLPLLSRRIEVTRLVLEGPQVVIDRDARGNLSIADLLGGAPGARPAPAGPEPEGPSPLAALLVERIDVRGGKLTFRDRLIVPGREVTTVVSDIAATLDDVSVDRPVEIDLRATFLSLTPQNVVLAGTLGPIGPDLALMAAPADLRLEAADLDLEEVAAYAGARTGGPEPALAAAPASPLVLAGTGSLTATLQGPLGAPAVKVTADLTPAAITYGRALAKAAGVPLVLTAEAAVQQVGQGTPVVRLDPLTLTVHTLTLTATGRVANPASPAVSLAVKSNEASLEGWERLVPALAGAALDGRVSLEAAVRGRPLDPEALDLSGTVRVAGLEVEHPSLPKPLTDGAGVLRIAGRRAVLDRFQAKLGGSPVSLTAEVPELSRRYVRFALESPKLDLDPLIAAAGAGGGDATAPAPAGKKPAARAPDASPPAAGRGAGASGPAAGSAGAPGEAVAGLAADGTVRIAQGALRGIRFSDLQGRLELRDRVVTLEQLTFGLYGGRFAGSGRADLRGSVPAIAFSSKLQNVKANEILSENTSVDGIVFGLLSADLDIEGKGLDASGLLASLSGAGNFSLADGRLASFDLLDRLRSLVALARGEQPAAAASSGGTRVETLSSSVRIDRGRFVTPDLALSTGDFALKGSGSLGFDQSLAYDLRAVLPGPLARQILGRDVARLLADSSGAVVIPFAMKGTLSAPTFSLSGRFIEGRLRRRLEEELGEKLQRGLERMLRGRKGDGGASGDAGAGSPSPEPAAPEKLLEDLLGR